MILIGVCVCVCFVCLIVDVQTAADALHDLMGMV